MRTLSIALCLLFGGAVAAKAAPQYPKVAEVQGVVRWTDKDGKETPAKNKQVLIEKAALQTGDKSQVLVEVDAFRQIRLYPNSRLEIPSISWETGEAPVLLLKSGRFRWKDTHIKAYNVALRSDLFEFLGPPGDFVFTYEPKTAVAEAKALEGSMEFSAMNAEDVALVTAGQKVQFQGVREGDEIVYDVLLKGKKIPRGKLGLVQPLTAEEKKLYSAAREKKADQARHQKEMAEKKAKQTPKDPQAICVSPPARLNHCAWICENNPKKEKKLCRLEKAEVRCLRKRCNANGEWSEETEVAKDKASGLCSAQPLVKECDYYNRLVCGTERLDFCACFDSKSRV
jgi:hypothetical protein